MRHTDIAHLWIEMDDSTETRADGRRRDPIVSFTGLGLGGPHTLHQLFPISTDFRRMTLGRADAVLVMWRILRPVLRGCFRA